MLDWFSGQLMADATSLKLGRVCLVNEDGEIEAEWEKWRQVEGSWSSKLSVRRGSPNKALERAARLRGPPQRAGVEAG